MSTTWQEFNQKIAPIPVMSDEGHIREYENLLHEEERARSRLKFAGTRYARERAEQRIAWIVKEQQKHRPFTSSRSLVGSVYSNKKGEHIRPKGKVAECLYFRSCKTFISREDARSDGMCPEHRYEALLNTEKNNPNERN